MGEYGLPKEMLTDNGQQYTNWRGTARFEKELGKESVKHIRSSPHYPIILSKIESFWETMLTEFLQHAQFTSFDDSARSISFWVKYYNHKRPHQGMQAMIAALSPNTTGKPAALNARLPRLMDKTLADPTAKL